MGSNRFRIRSSGSGCLTSNSEQVFRWWGLLWILLTFLVMFAGFTVRWAFADEVMQLTDRFGVGARAMGMGGAAIAVSEDFSALYCNPAGLAQVRRIEITGGLSHQRYTCRTTYYGNDTKDRENNTNLNSMGMVFPVPTYRGSLVFALGMARAENFAALFVQQGYSLQNDWWEDGREIQSGGLFAWSLGGAVDVSPTLSLGAVLNLWDGDYNYDWNASFTDTRDVWNEYPNDYNTTDIHDTESADFDGWSLKMGGLLRLSRFLKVGMTIDCPVNYDISGDVVMRTQDVFDNGDVEQYGESLYFQNEISTPWEFGFGMAWSVPTFLLAADLRYADWSQIKFNNESLEGYEETLSLSVGGEYVLPRVGAKIRAGYSSEPLANTLSTIIEERRYYTLGAGFLVGQVMTLDLAWVHGTWKTSQSFLTEKDEVDRVFLSMAYRF